jgi:glucosamine--fructose-6-phosphate aminotransferase (isomerizing)
VRAEGIGQELAVALEFEENLALSAKKTPDEGRADPATKTHMFEEARASAQVVRGQLQANRQPMVELGARLRRMQPRAVVTVGRGSSDHAATFAQYLIETRLGVMTSSVAPSVSSLYNAPPDMEGVVCLAISQSGKSPDLLTAIEGAKAAGAFVVALVNADSPLARLADEVAPLRAGPEISVAATKSYNAALSAIVQITAAWTEDAVLMAAVYDLPDLLDQAWARDWSPAVQALKDARNLYVIGRGVGFGVAQEAALTFKETCGLHAEAFSAAEVRHGPMALVRKDFPVLVFSQNDQSRAGVDELVAEFVSRGANVMVAGGSDEREGVRRLPSLSAHPVIEPILYVQSFYRMVDALALARGFDPDRPPHLNKITETV